MKNILFRVHIIPNESDFGVSLPVNPKSIKYYGDHIYKKSKIKSVIFQCRWLQRSGFKVFFLPRINLFLCIFIVRTGENGRSILSLDARTYGKPSQKEG